MKAMFRSLVVALLCVTASIASAQTLRIALGDPFQTIDPHFDASNANEGSMLHVYDALTKLDEGSRVTPGLAESWRLVDEQTWEFRLRHGVKFHNGEEFTAEDVAFTIDRVGKVPNSTAPYTTFTAFIKRVEIVDRYTVRFKTDGLYPLLHTDIAMVGMLNKKTHEGVASADFNSGKAAIGTGPYKFVSYTPGDRLELVRNDNYWGPKSNWEKVTLRNIPNNATRLAALLSGDIDLISAVPTTDLDQIRKNTKLKLTEAVGLKLLIILLDQSRDGPPPFITGPNGEKLDKNPLMDVRVRKALSISVNRPGIVDNVMSGGAVASGQVMPKGAFGYVPGLEAEYDPAKARQLLAEAGFPNGFRITVHGTNDRYVNDSAVLQAVGQMWERIGVRTTVQPLPYATMIGPASRQEYSAFMYAYGSPSGEASKPLRSLLATYDPKNGYGTTNRSRYSNPKMDALVVKGLETAGDAEREKLFQEATRVAMADYPMVQLHHQMDIWAMRGDLTYPVRLDGFTLAFNVRPAGAADARK